MHQFLISGALLLAASVSALPSSNPSYRSLHRINARADGVAAAPAPPPLRFPDNIWNVNDHEDVLKKAKITAAYEEAFALAQYAMKDVQTTPLDIQNTPRLYFSPDNLKRYGKVEKVMSLFGLQSATENFSYIFESITVIKAAPNDEGCGPRVAAFVTPIGSSTTETQMTICEFFWSPLVGASLFDKPCEAMCDQPDITWVSLGSIILHELTHIKEVARKGLTGIGQINDIKMNYYPTASADCKEYGAYGSKCCQELNQLNTELTYVNADSYAWMTIEQVVGGRCFTGRSKDACYKKEEVISG